VTRPGFGPARIRNSGVFHGDEGTGLRRDRASDGSAPRAPTAERESTDSPKRRPRFSGPSTRSCQRLSDPVRAIDGSSKRLTSISVRPDASSRGDDSAAHEQMVRRLGRRRRDVMKKGPADREAQAKLCEHIVRWLRRREGRPESPSSKETLGRSIERTRWCRSSWPSLPRIRKLRPRGRAEARVDGLRRKVRLPYTSPSEISTTFYLSDVKGSKRPTESALEIGRGLDAWASRAHLTRAQAKTASSKESSEAGAERERAPTRIQTGKP